MNDDIETTFQADPPRPPLTGAVLRLLARQVPCLGRQTPQTGPIAICRCDGCQAGAALELAAGHLDAGDVLEADIKLGHAAYLYSAGPVVEAQRELHRVVLAAAAEAQLEAIEALVGGAP